jgi:hypothetical protein
MAEKRIVKKYLVAREGESKFAGLSQEELDTLLKEGKVQCGDKILEAREGDEIIKIEVAEQYEVKRKEGVCYLKPSGEDS